MTDRLSWDQYFIGMAQMAASRATCPRKSVGAVLVRANNILSTGYNGTVRGMPHCTEVGCDMEDTHCVATMHAEANAVVLAARHGIRIDGATLYTTASPCWPCFKVLANAGIVRIVYAEFYRDRRVFEVAGKLGIPMTHVPVQPGSVSTPIEE